MNSTNSMSHTGYGSGDNTNTSDVDSRLAANEEKARRWFNKVSQLDSSADINSVIADDDFPEIMPLRKGVNRFVVSTRKTSLEKRLVNAQYRRNLGNGGTAGVEDFKAVESTKSHDTLDDILGRSGGITQSDNKNIVAEHNSSINVIGVDNRAMACKLLWQRRLLRFLHQSPSSCPHVHSSPIHGARILSVPTSEILCLSPHNSYLPALGSSRSLCSQSSNLVDESQVPTAIDYCSVLQEGEFHRLADSTIHSLQEKLEDYGDSVDVDGFDIDYGNDVLTIKVGNLGTYVLNKQTPNRQLWLSSLVSGPSRFDWDQDAKAWIYRRNKTNLSKILENELEELCCKPIVFS